MHFNFWPFSLWGLGTWLPRCRRRFLVYYQRNRKSWGLNERASEDDYPSDAIARFSLKALCKLFGGNLHGLSRVSQRSVHLAPAARTDCGEDFIGAEF